MTLQHVHMEISLPRKVSAVKICNLGKDGPRKLREGVKPYSIDNYGSYLDEVSIRINVTGENVGTGYGSHRLVGQGESL